MIQGRDCPGIALETLAAIGVVLEVRRQSLDGAERFSRVSKAL
jgi:hypothetical protein